jgi:hypothetical protein
MLDEETIISVILGDAESWRKLNSFPDSDGLEHLLEGKDLVHKDEDELEEREGGYKRQRS